MCYSCVLKCTHARAHTHIGHRAFYKLKSEENVRVVRLSITNKAIKGAAHESEQTILTCLRKPSQSSLFSVAPGDKGATSAVTGWVAPCIWLWGWQPLCSLDAGTCPSFIPYVSCLLVEVVLSGQPATSWMYNHHGNRGYNQSLGMCPRAPTCLLSKHLFVFWVVPFEWVPSLCVQICPWVTVNTGISCSMLLPV